MNHLDRINFFSNIPMNNVYNLLKYKKKQNRLKSILFVSSILSGSYIDKLEILNEGDIIEQVNNINVNKIEELNVIIKQNKNIFINLKIHDKKNIIMDINSIIDNEKYISEKYSYKPTKIFELLEFSQSYTNNNLSKICLLKN